MDGTGCRLRTTALLPGTSPEIPLGHRPVETGIVGGRRPGLIRRGRSVRHEGLPGTARVSDPAGGTPDPAGRDARGSHSRPPRTRTPAPKVQEDRRTLKTPVRSGYTEVLRRPGRQRDLERQNSSWSGTDFSTRSPPAARPAAPGGHVRSGPDSVDCPAPTTERPALAGLRRGEWMRLSEREATTVVGGQVRPRARRRPGRGSGGIRGRRALPAPRSEAAAATTRRPRPLAPGGR